MPAGVVFVGQNKLSPGYRVGQRVPLRTDADTLTYQGYVRLITFGGAIDLVRSR